MSATTKSHDKSSSGVARWRNEIVQGFIFLTVVYYASYYIVGRADHGFEPAPQFCTNQPSDKPCSRPDLFAFQVVAFIMQNFMGIKGLLAWHINKSAHSVKTPEGRLFGYIPECESLMAGSFVYQLWDFFFSLTIPEHATPILLGHHLATGLTAYLSLEYQVVHHYAIYFGGCSEISSMFLVFCDFDVYFPASRGSLFAAFIAVCQASFALLFFAYRVFGWIKVSIQLWQDALHVQRQGNAEGFLQPGNRWVLYYFLFIDIALGSLQLYWFFFALTPKIIEILNS